MKWQEVYWSSIDDIPRSVSRHGTFAELPAFTHNRLKLLGKHCVSFGFRRSLHDFYTVSGWKSLPEKWLSTVFLGVPGTQKSSNFALRVL